MMRSESDPWLVPIRIATPQLPAAADQGSEALGHPLELHLRTRSRVLAHLELLLVGVVPRIDPDLLDVLRGDQRRVRREVDVRDERHAIHPAASELATGSPSRFSAWRLIEGAVTRTISQPASDQPHASASTVADVSMVSVVVIDWTRIGLRTADADVADAHLARHAALRGGTDRAT